MADANPVWQFHHSRGSHGKAVTGQKRLSFALEFVVSISREAGVAELADALDSKSSDRKIVWVRAPPPAVRLTLSLTREN
jgi:hypothetical protein